MGLEDIGAISLVQHLILQRVIDGTLPPEKVLGGLKSLSEGNFDALPHNAHRLIECEKEPLIPDGYRIDPADQLNLCVRGECIFDPKRIYFTPCKPLPDMGELPVVRLGSIFPASALDHLLAHPSLIPEEWKRCENGKVRYLFSLTIYRDLENELRLRCMYFLDGQWRWCFRLLKSLFTEEDMFICLDPAPAT